MRRNQEAPRRSQQGSLVSRITTVRFLECQKNQAIETGEHVLDGCQEFLMYRDAKGVATLICAACGCQREFHRKDVKIDFTRTSESNCSSESSTSGH